MCCLFSVLLFLGPRAGILFWYIFDPSRWQHTFAFWLWPLLGSVFLPWTTLMYVIVYPGGVNGLDWLWLALALVVDLFSYSGSAYGNRRRIRR